MTPKQNYYSLTAYKIIQALGKRNMKGFYCDTKEEALEKALGLLSQGSVVSWGGSQTIMQIGLIDDLRKSAEEGKYTVIDRDICKTDEEREEAYHKALRSDYYFMSANAITINGLLVNIDGYGNRLAALAFGPKNVVAIIGMNKVEPNEEHALERARKFAAPINAIRLNKTTPCVTTGLCQNCTEEGCICSHIMVTRMCNPKNRIKVILVGEELGF